MTPSRIAVTHGTGRVVVLAVSLLIAACKGEPTQPVNTISVVVETATPTVEVNQSVNVSATVRNSDGTAVTDRTVTWSSSNVVVATVTSDPGTVTSGAQTALVQALSPGTATIAASVSGSSGAITLTVVASTAQRAQAFVWTQQDGLVAISELPGVTASYANAINDAGQVVGSMHIGSVDHAFIWSRSQGMVDLGVLPGMTHSSAASINSSGQVVGWSSTASGSVSHAFRWSQSTGMIDLGVFAGSDDSFAYGINAGGQVVGETYANTTNIRRPFRWTEGKGLEDLGALPGDAAGGAYAINDDGTIVGFSTTALYRAGTVRAIQWSAAGVKTEVAGCSGVCYAAANAINRTGQVVGSQTDRVFRWTPAGGLVDLGGLPGAQFSEATGINDLAQVVGYSRVGLAYRAFVWTQTAGFVDIGLLPGKTWSLATAINNGGQIVGYGQ